MTRVAVFVSPHGFGHAARASAVVAALGELVPALEVVLYTSVPRWFFEESLGELPFVYRQLACDVGLVQRNPMEEDLAATADRLERFWREVNDFRLADLTSELRESDLAAVVCDVSPLGLLAAEEAGIPSILVENFTWDWIYALLVGSEPRLAQWIRSLRPIFAAADLRIQTEPVCAPVAPPVAQEAQRVVQVPPVARRARSLHSQVRSRLAVGHDEALVLVSFGGVQGLVAEPAAWAVPDGVVVVVPGGGEVETRRGNVILLPHHSPLYHPDLVAAADVVVGKLGYSTVAETYAAGCRVLYVPRPAFRESRVLERFVRERLPADATSVEELANGAWLRRLPRLLATPRPAAPHQLGATPAAEAIRPLLRVTKASP